MEKMEVFYVILLLFVYTRIGSALECYQCSTESASTNVEGLDQYFDGLNSNPQCITAPSQTKSTTCNHSYQKCSYIKATMKISYEGKSVSVDSVRRGCYPVDADIKDGCQSDKSDLKQQMREQMKSLYSDEYDIKLTGLDVCFCSSDRCTVCERTYVPFGAFCLPMWGVFVMALAVIALLAILICCCCCRRKNNRGRRQDPPPPYTATPSGDIPNQEISMDGSVAFNNPGFKYPEIEK